MKIKDIIVEGVLSGIVGGLKGAAKGVAELPGKAKAGYQASAETPVTTPDGYKPGVIQPSTGAARYGNDIASAIRAGAAGDISYKQATDAKTQTAPVGTAIGQWKQTNQGWVNTKNNTAANPTQAAQLDREWTKFAQKDAKKAEADRQAQLKQQQSGIPPDPGGNEDEKPSPTATREYNPRSHKWGWRDGNNWVSDEYDNQPDQQDAPKGPKEAPKVSGFEVVSQDPMMIRYQKNDYTLDNNGEWIRRGTTKPVKDFDPTLEKLLDRASGAEQDAATMKQPSQTQQGKPTIISTVTTPDGVKANKWSDGVWSTPEGGENVQVVDSDVPRLEKLLATQGQKPHTGGRQKGSLSQTPNAIRKRAARAEMPAVFKSNRR